MNNNKTTDNSKIVDPVLEKIKAIRRDCTHEGHWISSGIVSLPQSKTELVFLVIILCKNCGRVEIKDVHIPTVAATNIPVVTGFPNFVRGMKKN